MWKANCLCAITGHLFVRLCCFSQAYAHASAAVSSRDPRHKLMIDEGGGVARAEDAQSYTSLNGCRRDILLLHFDLELLVVAQRGPYNLGTVRHACNDTPTRSR